MIARKMTFALLFKFLTQGLGYISLYFVAHYMGPEVIGIIAFATAYIALFQSFSDMGFGTAHIKRVSEGKDFGRCNGTYFTVRFILLIVMTLIVLISIFYTKYILHKPFISREHEIVLYIMLVVNFIQSISTGLDITFAARKETAKSHIGAFAGKVVLVLSKVIVAIAGLGVIMLAGVSIISAITVLCIYLYFFKGYPLKKPTKESFKNYAVFAIPVMFTGFISKFSNNIDRVMIQLFWSAKELGFYSVSIQLILLLSSISSISAVLIFPTISKYHSQGKIEDICRLSDRAERYISMILLPVIAYIFIFSKQICLIMFGPEFILITPQILIILSFVAYFDAITSNYKLQISGTNHIKLSAVLSFCIFGLHILLNLIFIPSKLFGIRLLGIGAIGASCATLLATIISSVVYRFYAFKITKSKTNPVIFIHFIAAFIMALFLHLFTKIFSKIVWYHLIVSGISGVFVYLFILYILKEFTIEDLKYYLNILNPNFLKDYAKKEIRNGYKEV